MTTTTTNNNTQHNSYCNTQSIPATNKYIQKYHLDQNYPFTETQITFLLQLQHYLRRSYSHSHSDSDSNNNNNNNSNGSNDNHGSISTVITIAASDSYLLKKSPIFNALKWIDTHLLLPYYSKSFLYDLVQSAIEHSHVFLFNTETYESGNGDDFNTTDSSYTNNNEDGNDVNDYGNVNDNDDDDDDAMSLAAPMHLFLDAMSGLSGRKGGPAFEIKVLYQFMLKRMSNDDHDEVKNDMNDHDINDTSNNNSSDNNHSILQSNATFDQDETVDIEEMIGLLYRLALSCHVMQNWSTGMDTEMDMDMDTGTKNEPELPGDTNNSNEKDTNGLPQLSKILDLEHIASLGKVPPKNMVDSLGTYQDTSSSSSSSSSSMYDYSNGGNFGESNSKTEEVTYETFRNWVEINFPQMACIVSSFIHLAFFSWDDGVKSIARSIQTDKKPSDTDIIPSNDHENRENESKGKHLDDNDDVDDDDDGSNDDAYMTNLLSYAQGKRTIFQFPTLQQLVLKNYLGRRNSISRKIIGTPTVSSVLFDTQQTYNNNDEDGQTISSTGVAGHFAFGMACMDSSLCGEWHRLYSTETDGFAFLNMQRALTGYTGPTVMIIRPTKATAFGDPNSASASPGLFGFYTANPWRESNKFYGSSDCFLFRADPIWNVYRPQGFVQGWKIDQNIENSSMSSPLRKKKMKKNFMYFHPSAGHVNNGGGIKTSGSNRYGSSSSMKAKASGIILGGTVDQPRLFISETFEQCVASSGSMMDMTFESGPLLPGQWDKYYNIDVLEVWGVGGEDTVRDATSSKDKHGDMIDAVRRKVQSVDRKQFLDDFRSGLLGNKLFEHRLDGNIRHNFEGGGDNQERCE